MNRIIVVTAAVLTVAACSAARQFDTAPSVTGSVSKALYFEAEYPTFVAKWMGNGTPLVPAGAVANFVFRIDPPNRPGYNRVGGKELDDAIKEFGKWCSANGGREKPQGHAHHDRVEHQLVAVLQRPATAVAPGAYYGCERSSVVIALISVHLNKSVTDEPAVLTVTHYTQSEIAQAAARRQESERVAALRTQQAISAATAQAREHDAAYRKTLKVGDRVRWDRDFGSGFATRGLVVEMRPPIALIQLDNVTPSPQWVHIDQLRRPN